MHKCIVGMLWLTEEAILATAKDVSTDIMNDMDARDEMKKWGYTPLRNIFSPKQYTDWRCSTNLERFKYCPCCGEKIDWKKVRTEIEKDLEAKGYNANY